MSAFPDSASRFSGAWLLAAVLLGLTSYRAISGFIDPLPFQVDEAQYVGWSHAMAAGYYSKPPVIAWAIAGGQGVCSLIGVESAEGCARLLQPFAFFAAAIGVAGAAFCVSRSRKLAICASVIFITMPLTGFYSLFVTTDAWLLMFWSLALWVLVAATRVVDKPPVWHWMLWPLCGVLVGFGLLSKYSMGAFLISAFFWLLLTRRLSERGPWMALLAAFIVFLPNLLWNIENQYPTFAHHAEISQIGTDNVSVQSFSDRFTSITTFITAQFGLFGPLLFVVMLMSLQSVRGFFSQRRTLSASSGMLLMHTMTWLILLLAVVQAFSSRAFANWAAPAYVSGSILVAYLLTHESISGRSRWGRPVLIVSIVLALAASIFLIHAPKSIFANTSSDGYRVRPLEKLRGFKEVALWAKEVVTQERDLGKNWAVLADDRRVLAAISAYAYPDIQTPYAWNPENRRESHYTWFLDARKHSFDPSQHFLLLQLVKPGFETKAPALPKYRVVREIDIGYLRSLRIGGDGERLIAYEIALER